MSSTAFNDVEGLLVALEASIIPPAKRDGCARGEAVSLGSGKADWLHGFDASVRLESFLFAEETSVKIGIADCIGDGNEMLLIVGYDGDWCWYRSSGGCL